MKKGAKLISTVLVITMLLSLSPLTSYAYQELQNARLEGFEIPMAGRTPERMDVSLEIVNDGLIGYVDWIDDETGNFLESDTVFVAGKKYRAMFTFAFLPGYDYAPDFYVQLNKKTDLIETDLLSIFGKIPSGYTRNGDCLFFYEQGVRFCIAFTVALTCRSAYSIPSIKRIKGQTRTETAVEISKYNFASGSECVILASGDGYADALSGVPLAAELDAPILLVHNKVLNESTRTEIKRLGANHVIILGGTASISETVVDDLRLINQDMVVERIKGVTRYGTAVEIAKYIDSIYGGEQASTLLFVNGQNFPDALSISSVAGKMGWPILYINNKGTIDDATKEYLNNYTEKTNSFIIGGTAAIAQDAEINIERELLKETEIERIYGQDRYATCIEIINKFDMDESCIFAASGTNFPDALAGGAVAAQYGYPVVLLPGSVSGPSDAKIIRQLSYIDAAVPNQILILGGLAAVNDSIAKMLEQTFPSVKAN